jgi:hypothetical protein
MVHLKLLNSRMKDFFDIGLLARTFAFDGGVLAGAVARTFANRGTPLESEPLALTPTFAEDRTKQAQWAGFLRKTRTISAPERLTDVVGEIRTFLLPVVEKLLRSEPIEITWKPGGPWA